MRPTRVPPFSTNITRGLVNQQHQQIFDEMEFAKPGIRGRRSLIGDTYPSRLNSCTTISNGIWGATVNGVYNMKH